MFFDLSSAQMIFISIIATLMALFVAMPFHEFAHAFAAKREGDYTAVAMRRYTLAFHEHFDFFGFLCLFFLGFGWAKPVPVDSRNFKRGRKSQFIVSIAGIVANLILGIAFLFIYVLYIKFATDAFFFSFYGQLLYYFLSTSFSLNFMLAFFNLLPLYPLDGYRIIDSFCRQDNDILGFMRKYSTILYIIIIVTGVFSLLYANTMGRLVTLLFELFSKIVGL